MAKPPRQPARDEPVKERVYEAIQRKVHEVLSEKEHDRRLSRLACKDVFDAVIDTLFTGLLREGEEGYFRLPLGYGTIRVKRFKARPPKSMPTRENLPVAPTAKSETRLHVRYSEGATVKKALGTYKGTYHRHGDRIPMVLRKPVK